MMQCHKDHSFSNSIDGVQENPKSVVFDIVKTLGSAAVNNSELLKNKSTRGIHIRPQSGSAAANGSNSSSNGDFVFDPQGVAEKFYSGISTSENPEKPWRQDDKYFQTVHISLIAFIKMSLHARSGGSIEIMGVMTGKVFGKDMVIMDCYPLPVEGSESRVNAQNEAYEFMLKYSDALKSVKGREENIIGWYHSHPGFGCWLSGIDVQTQALNQGFQDPYVAIVIDPERSIKQGLVEIGAFRTLPEKKGRKESINNNKTNNTTNHNKGKDLGFHSDKYYALDIKLFRNEKDKQLLELLSNEFWFNSLENFNKEDYSKLMNKLNVLKSSLYKEENELLVGFNTRSIRSDIMTPRSGITGSRRSNRSLLNEKFKRKSIMSSSRSDDSDDDLSDYYEGSGNNIAITIGQTRQGRPLSYDQAAGQQDAKRRSIENPQVSVPSSSSSLNSENNSGAHLKREKESVSKEVSKSIRDLQMLSIQLIKRELVRDVQEDLFGL